jgi:hypothetical protein
MKRKTKFPTAADKGANNAIKNKPVVPVHMSLCAYKTPKPAMVEKPSVYAKYRIRNEKVTGNLDFASEMVFANLPKESFIFASSDDDV